MLEGRRLPTEAEYHRAAFGTPAAASARYPWGERPDATHGNVDFQSWEPVPVGSCPAGASAWGVHDLVGNGWEWTSTVFARVRRIRADAVLSRILGRLLRRTALRHEGGVAGDGARAGPASFRNWFRANTLTSTRVQNERADDPQHRIASLEFRRGRRARPSLTPKQLQSKYLYDALGSSLFEAICRLPWYRITRAENAAPRASRPAKSSITRCSVPTIAPRATIVELGCGSGEKLMLLAEALQDRGAMHAST